MASAIIQSSNLFLKSVLTIYRWKRVTLHLPLLRDPVWFIFIFMERIASGCFRMFSDAMCLQLLPRVRCSALLLFDLPVTLSPVFDLCEREMVWDWSSLPMAGRVRISHEQRYCVVSKEQHELAFLPVPIRIFFFSPQTDICYARIKVQGIFP